MISLDGAVALVTGSSRGIGKAIAIQLARAGCDVCVTYLNAPRDGREVAEEISRLGRRAIAVKADLSVEEDIAELCRIVGEEFGKLDVLVSNAAGGGFRRLMEVKASQFDYAMRLNVQSLVHLAQHGFPLLSRSTMERSKIITISSLGGTRTIPNYGLPGTTKGALESATRQLAYELGPKGVNVNCVAPGLVKTGAAASMPKVEELLAARRKRSLAGYRDLMTTDVANVIVCLASPLMDTVQGHTLLVDLGGSLHA